jgi:regulatory protein
LPAEVVLAARLAVGVELDRGRARELNQELRRHHAMSKAASALGRRDLSHRELNARLARSRVAPGARSEVLERLTRAGALNDGRFAQARVELLVERGAGDALIRHDLATRGISAELVEAALAEIDPEHERAARIVRDRGSTPKTARYLARKGFSPDSIEGVCEEGVAEDAPPAVR